MTNVFELLPTEILRYIISDLNHKHMTMAYYSCKTFQRLNLKSLIKEREIKGYPRHQGYCEAHYIPETLTSFKRNTCIDRKQSGIILNYFYDNDTDLIKGDFIIFKSCIDIINEGYNTGIFMFDGINIINISGDYYEFGHIPDDFTVIYNGVPLKYWSDSNALGSDISIIWFNPHLVRQQCIDNIKYGLITDDKFAIYTSFEYDTITYTIIYDCIDEFDDFDDLFEENYKLVDDNAKLKYIEQFIALLSRNEEVLCNHEADNYDDINNNATLFMRYY